VSYYFHHGGWWIYFREGGKQVRRRVAENQADAQRVAAQVNAQLASGSPTLFSFEPVDVDALRRRFLDYHENVLRSSVATIARYRAATQHLEDFVQAECAGTQAHQIRADRFAAFLRHREVTPNGHKNTARRRLLDKGVRFILEVCRSLYGFAHRMRHLPPYAANPFADLRIDRMQLADAKSVFLFTAETELQFLQAADRWAFPMHFTLAKTGMRPGELAHLLIEDLDLQGGWLHVRNKIELGWRIKTGAERSVPLVPELCGVLRLAVGDRTAGPVFLQKRFLGGTAVPNQLNRNALARLFGERVATTERQQARSLNRAEKLRLARNLWRDAGALDGDDIRISYGRIARRAGLAEATCPKSWRHTFATLLQDANVDPLIRQLVLGHKPTDRRGGLGMTARYSHSRPETLKSSIDRALRLWPKSLESGARFSEARTTIKDKTNS
jgi:integrase